MDFLKITGLTKGFRKKKAVKNVSLTVKPGEITTLFGPGGSGKSMVLRCLAGLAQKDSGQILHGGNEMKSGKTDREIGFVPQKRVHLSGMTVRENMAYFAQIQGGKARNMTDSKSGAQVAQRVRLDLMQSWIDNVAEPHRQWLTSRRDHLLSIGRSRRLTNKNALSAQNMVNNRITLDVIVAVKQYKITYRRIIG